jgi:signal transduction histidine kinase
VKGHTLAGRLAIVQSGLTLLALMVVIIGTWLALTSVLERRRDAMLNEAAQRGVEVARMLGVYAQDADWMERELDEIRPSTVRLELQDPSGFVLASSGPELRAGPVRLGCHDSAAVRACATAFGIFTVRASSVKTPDIAERNRYLAALLVASVVAGAIVLLTSQRVARHALRPLFHLTEAIAAIEPGKGDRLQHPLALAELDRLRARFDELLDRFHQALARERRLTAQASHELRTPLGVARGEIEALATIDLDGGKARATAALDRLAELIEVLLWFARVQEPLDPARLAVVNMADLVRAELLERKGDMANILVCSQLPDEALVRGDEQLLRRVVANLLDNAIKHGDGGRIVICAGRDERHVLLRVSNSGPGPSLDLKERLFEPFFRAESGRVHATGFGLGLPFARAVVRAHGGDVELTVTSTERTEFVLTLPLVDWSGGILRASNLEQPSGAEPSRSFV